MMRHAIHITLMVAAMTVASCATAQRVEIYENAVVRDSVWAVIQRERAEGLWADAIASGELKGSATLDMVIDDKGRVESVFVRESDLPIPWKNAVKDQWFDRRFDFKLPKGHREKITLTVQFP